MPWMVRDAVDDINRAVGRRCQGLDLLLALVRHAHDVLELRRADVMLTL